MFLFYIQLILKVASLIIISYYIICIAFYDFKLFNYIALQIKVFW